MNEQVFAKVLVTIRDLMWYDGPLVSWCIDGENGKNYIIVWADIFKPDDGFSTSIWHAVEVTHETLDAYLLNQITLLQVEEQSPAIWVCTGEFIDSVGPTAKGVLTPFAEIPMDRRPTADSYLDDWSPYASRSAKALATPGDAEPVFRIVRDPLSDGEEGLEFFVNETSVGSVTYDGVGSEGMRAARSLFENIAETLSIQVKEE